MSALYDTFHILGGLFLLFIGAEWLVENSSRLASKYGVSQLIIGLTVIAFGTSSPELFISIGLNLSGNSDMALGNAIGSNICNIGLVLGASAIFYRIKIDDNVTIRDFPFLIISSVIFILFTINKNISTIEGYILFLGVIIFTIFQFILEKKQSLNQKNIISSGLNIEKKTDIKHDNIIKLIFFILIGLSALYFGSELLKNGSISLARKLGISEAIIALTLISFSTSIPELATSIMGAIKKKTDLVIGNIIGSCIFNLLCVIGATAILKPIIIDNINLIDLLIMLGFTVILTPFIVKSKSIGRLGGILLLLFYFTYISYLWINS